LDGDKRREGLDGEGEESQTKKERKKGGWRRDTRTDAEGPVCPFQKMKKTSDSKSGMKKGRTHGGKKRERVVVGAGQNHKE